jgi:hypothetical protein
MSNRPTFRRGFTPRSTYRASCRRRNSTSACSDLRDRNASASHPTRSATTRSTIETALSTCRSCHTRDAEPFQASRPGFLRTTGELFVTRQASGKKVHSNKRSIAGNLTVKLCRDLVAPFSVCTAESAGLSGHFVERCGLLHCERHERIRYPGFLSGGRRVGKALNLLPHAVGDGGVYAFGE